MNAWINSSSGDSRVIMNRSHFLYLSCSSCLFKNFIIYFLAVPALCRSVWTLSSCSERGLLSSCSAQASHSDGSSCCRAQALGYVGFGTCSNQALECWLSSCGIRAYLPGSMWNLPEAGIKPVSPALAGRFLTSGAPGKSPLCLCIWFKIALLPCHL